VGINVRNDACMMRWRMLAVRQFHVSCQLKSIRRLNCHLTAMTSPISLVINLPKLVLDGQPAKWPSWPWRVEKGLGLPRGRGAWVSSAATHVAGSSRLTDRLNDRTQTTHPAQSESARRHAGHATTQVYTVHQPPCLPPALVASI